MESDDNLCDDNILSMPMDLDLPMFLFNSGKMDDFSYFEQNNFETASSPSQWSNNSEQLSEFKTENEFSDTSIGGFIDPDDFLNVIIKKEDSDCSVGSNRDTPSPSYSSGSGSMIDYSKYTPMNNILLDSPPVSPPNISQPPHLVSIPAENCVQITAQQPANVQNVSHITDLTKLKKIKIQPKSSGGNNALLSKAINKKTILLSAQDYKALMDNMKNQTNKGNPAIIIKTQPPAIVDKPVLPKLKPPAKPVERPSAPNQFVVDSKVSQNVGDLMDVKTLKKQQRMIKNRESAYLSRIKKKEYVTSLEHKIDGLNKENVFLRNENQVLLQKLKVRCSCGAKLDNLSSISKQITPNVKKNTAIVLAMLFMVSLNFGPLGNLLTSNTQSSQEESTAVHQHTRSLLWVDEQIFNKSDNEVDFFNDTSANTNYDDLSKGEMCPFYINQTENIRLASELRKWIGENGYKNLTSYRTDDLNFNSLSNIFGLKDTLDSMYKQMKDINFQMKTFARKKQIAAQKLKNKKAKELQLYNQKNKTNDLQLFNSNYNMKYAEFFEEIGRRDDTFYVVSFSGEHLLLPALAHNKTNRPKMSLMLPAINVNASHSSEKVTLMQIDCEVMNTTLIQVREKLIPGNLLKPQTVKSGPANAKAKDELNMQSQRTSPRQYSNGEKNVTQKQQNKQQPSSKYQINNSKPYFIDKIDENIRHEYGIN